MCVCVANLILRDHQMSVHAMDMAMYMHCCHSDELQHLYMCPFICSLTKPLRKAMKTIPSDEPSKSQQERSFITSVCALLQHGLETLHNPQVKETPAATSGNLFNQINIPLIIQVTTCHCLYSSCEFSIVCLVCVVDQKLPTGFTVPRYCPSLSQGIHCSAYHYGSTNGTIDESVHCSR